MIGPPRGLKCADDLPGKSRKPATPSGSCIAAGLCNEQRRACQPSIPSEALGSGSRNAERTPRRPHSCPYPRAGRSICRAVENGGLKIVKSTLSVSNSLTALCSRPAAVASHRPRSRPVERSDGDLSHWLFLQSVLPHRLVHRTLHLSMRLPFLCKRLRHCPRFRRISDMRPLAGLSESP